jgi:hypothetical protein
MQLNSKLSIFDDEVKPCGRIDARCACLLEEAACAAVPRIPVARTSAHAYTLQVDNEEALRDALRAVTIPSTPTTR